MRQKIDKRRVYWFTFLTGFGSAYIGYMVRPFWLGLMGVCVVCAFNAQYFIKEESDEDKEDY